MTDTPLANDRSKTNLLVQFLRSVRATRYIFLDEHISYTYLILNTSRVPTENHLRVQLLFLATRIRTVVTDWNTRSINLETLVSWPA